MNPLITSAIVSGSALVISPIITIFVKEWIRLRPYANVSSRHTALAGKWSGMLKQSSNCDGKPIDMEVAISFTAKGKIIRGKTTFTPPGLAQRNLDLVGGFLRDEFVKLDYINQVKEISHFGCFIARLDVTEDRKVLDGRFVGYGPDTKGIVYGTAVLNKMP